MKIQGELQHVLGGHRRSDSQGGGLSHQQWQQEIEKAHTQMLDKMRAVSRNPATELTANQVSLQELDHQPLILQKGETHRFAQTPLSAFPLELSRVSPAAASEVRPIGMAHNPNENVGVLFQSTVTRALNTGISVQKGVSANTQNESLVVYEPWSKENFHVTDTEDGLVVWMRNAALSEADENRIADTLRRQASQLGARLHKIYFNGRPLQAVASDAQ